MGRSKVIEEEELLDRLLEAFADLGYEGTSIRELCRHLGVSHSLIHIRYQSKDAAWYAAVDHGFDKLLQLMTAVEPEDLPEDPFEILRLALLRYAEATFQFPALARIIQQEGSRPGPRFDYMFKKYIRPTRSASEVHLRSMQQQGLVREGASVETIQFFLTTWGIGGLASAPPEIRYLRKKGAPTPKQLVEDVVDVVINGLRRNPPGQPGR